MKKGHRDAVVLRHGFHELVAGVDPRSNLHFMMAVLLLHGCHAEWA